AVRAGRALYRRLRGAAALQPAPRLRAQARSDHRRHQRIGRAARHHGYRCRRRQGRESRKGRSRRGRRRFPGRRRPRQVRHRKRIRHAKRVRQQEEQGCPMNRAPTSSLTDLIALAQEPSSAKRRELLREITNIFMTNPEDINDAEMALYDTVMSQLSNDMETVVRAEIANTLARAGAAPLGLLRRLASDHIDVAEPILERSKALTENDLMHVVSNMSQDHLRAVSRREEVPESISGVIVRRGDDDTLHTLLTND